jgi:hypothetical protein
MLPLVEHHDAKNVAYSRVLVLSKFCVVISSVKNSGRVNSQTSRDIPVQNIQSVVIFQYKIFSQQRYSNQNIQSVVIFRSKIFCQNIQSVAISQSKIFCQ